MIVSIVGGLDRNAARVQRMGDELGLQLEVHPGHLSPLKAEGLKKSLARSAHIVVLLDLVSHGAVDKVQRTAREAGVTVHLLRTSGLSRLRSVLEELAGARRAA